LPGAPIPLILEPYGLSAPSAAEADARDGAYWQQIGRRQQTGQPVSVYVAAEKRQPRRPLLDVARIDEADHAKVRVTLAKLDEKKVREIRRLYGTGNWR
jgi:hypothetical protein